MSRILFSMGAILLLLAISIQAQNLLDGPECIAFDSLNNRYLVTNVYSGRIVEYDINGHQIRYWGNEQHAGYALGCVIDGNTFYYSSGDYYVYGIDLDTEDDVWVWNTSPGMGVDGLAADTSGYLYVVGRLNGYIKKIRISDKFTTTLVYSGLPDSPQELYFDAPNNRLIVCAWSANAPIVAVDVNTGVISTIVSDNVAWRDGVTMDPDGNIYTASEVHGVVSMFEKTFTQPQVTIKEGLVGPSGLEFNWRDSILVVPVTDIDTVLFLSMHDEDEDGIYEFEDNCLAVANSDQEDFDEDGIGDLCDGCPENYNPGREDIDEDGVEDACDNCPEHSNPGQEDSNGNDVGDLCDYICGDGDGNGSIDILDVVFIINFKYKEGPAPDPLESADVNGDIQVTILDVVYLINFRYKEGPEPACVVWEY